MGKILSRLRDSLVGHKEVMSVWHNLNQTQNLEGTFVFVGPPGVGKTKTALVLIQDILCTKNQNKACGECGSCLRVEQGQHESLLQIHPNSGLIKTEQAHDVLRFCHLQNLTKKRFVLIEDADRLGLAPANILLKTLEEPPPGTVIILTAPSTTALLPTIRSRARVFRFQPLSPEEMLNSHLGPDWAIQASQGRMDRLSKLMDPQQALKRKTSLQLLQRILLSADMLTDDSWREALKSRDETRENLEHWLGMIRDALYLNQGNSEGLMNPDLKSDLEKFLVFSEEKLHFIFQRLIELQRQMQFNKDAVLSLETLYIQNR